jgi:hypothetical protein
MGVACEVEDELEGGGVRREVGVMGGGGDRGASCAWTMEETWGSVVAMVAEAGLIPSDARSWFVSEVIAVEEEVLKSPDTQ